MRCRSEPDDVGTVLDGTVVLITGAVVKGDVDRHKGWLAISTWDAELTSIW
jgi:hypothetical protein